MTLACAKTKINRDINIVFAEELEIQVFRIYLNVASTTRDIITRRPLKLVLRHLFEGSPKHWGRND